MQTNQKREKKCSLKAKKTQANKQTNKQFSKIFQKKLICYKQASKQSRYQNFFEEDSKMISFLYDFLLLLYEKQKGKFSLLFGSTLK